MDKLRILSSLSLRISIFLSLVVYRDKEQSMPEKRKKGNKKKNTTTTNKNKISRLPSDRLYGCLVHSVEYKCTG